MCATSTMSLHPTPPTHPNPTCYVASNMCATSAMSLHPTHPPQPHVLRSIQHVCNFNHVFTPHPNHPPNPTCYVASNMCATSTMSLHPTPPTHPNPTCYVASNMCATSTMSLHPTPPIHPNPRDRREGKCIDPTVYSGRSTFRNASLRPTGANNKPSKGIAQTPTNQTQQKYNPDVPQWPLSMQSKKSPFYSRIIVVECFY